MNVAVANLDFLAFCLQEAPGVGAATLRAVLRRMEQERCDADGFLTLDDRTLQARFGLKREAVAFVRSPDEKVVETWQMLQQKGVTVLVRGQAGYPDRMNKVLGETAPPILYVLGRTELFQAPSVGFCGSRKASEKGLKVAEDASRLLAGEQVNVISGYAHGVDLAAHKGALEAGGTTTIVLAEGILHFRTKEQLRDALGEDPLARALVVSEFPPRLPWKAHNAMTRNRTICGLSNAMIVIESGLEGGTFEAGKTALEIKVPLVCVEYAEPSPSAAGNSYFLQHGAISLKRARNGQPNLSKILAVVRDSAATSFTVATPQPQFVLHEKSPPYTAPAPKPEQIKMTAYPKRLIEVDLPIKRISAHARREKSVGHISSLHIWWARRPLAACRAVICAALWPDPADDNCPSVFRKAAAKIILDFAHRITADTKLANEHCSPENYKAWSKLAAQPSTLNSQPTGLRTALLDFIADFANWDNSTVREYLDTSRALTQAAHEALGGVPGTRPLVVDPFAGGGSIPLEALRVGADAFGSDLNPVPVLLNKVLLEYIPKYGQRLADEVRKGGEWIQCEAKKELASFYPKNAEGATPIAYLWARTVKCEGPGCGAEIPIIRSRWLVKGKNPASFFVISGKTINGKPSVVVEVKTGRPDQTSFAGTVKRGSVTCPVCGFTVSRQRVEAVAKQEGLGERMLAVVFVKQGTTGRTFATPSDKDIKAWNATVNLTAKNDQHFFGELSNIPDEPLPYLRSIFNVHVYGVTRWSELFNRRQLLGAVTFAKLVRRLCDELREKDFEDDFASAVVTMLALAADRQINALNRTCYWNPTGPKMQAGFARQAIPMFWDYCEANPFGGSVGSWESMVKCVSASFEAIDKPPGTGSSVNSSATQHPLPDDSADSVVTDPPYYDAVPYADLSDFFYVWLKRMLSNVHPGLFKGRLSPKELEVVQLAERNPAYAYKTKDNFENLMMKSLAEARRVAKPHSASVVVFAHQSTAGWEAMLSALINAGWIVTASWPIDTEMPTRVRAQNSAVLASSVHLLCRPRENPDGSVRTDEVGDWRDVLQELPRRIHEWMPRLAEEGVVGADSIFACLGPALEIFSRYSRVEKASGELVTLKEYLEQIWAAVAKEALALVFKDADTTGFEADARLTAMWLWTLNAGNTDATNGDNTEEDDADEESEGGAKKAKATGFVLEFDAARKIAQGLGANLEDLGSLVEVSGETARLLPVGERAHHLFGKDEGQVTITRKKKAPQLDLFKVLEQADDGGTTFGETKVERHGETVLDRIHQSMILFAAGRSEAMKRFLVEDGAGRDPRFWRLAQALSALYPSHTDEKRWVDGVLARKKGLGF